MLEIINVTRKIVQKEILTDRFLTCDKDRSYIQDSNLSNWIKGDAIYLDKEQKRRKIFKENASLIP